MSLTQKTANRLHRIAHELERIQARADGTRFEDVNTPLSRAREEINRAASIIEDTA